MNGRQSKKIRRELRQKTKELETKIAFGFKEWVNELPFKDRFKIAYRITIGRF